MQAARLAWPWLVDKCLRKGTRFHVQCNSEIPVYLVNRTLGLRESGANHGLSCFVCESRGLGCVQVCSDVLGGSTAR
jgi:hypothetical protein